MLTDNKSYYIEVKDSVGKFPPIPLGFNIANNVAKAARVSMLDSKMVKCGIDTFGAFLEYVIEVVTGNNSVLLNLGIDKNNMLAAAFSSPRAITGLNAFNPLPFRSRDKGQIICKSCTIDEAYETLIAGYDFAIGAITLLTDGLTLSVVGLPAAGTTEATGYILSTAKLKAQLSAAISCFHGFPNDQRFDWHYKDLALTPYPVASDQPPIISNPSLNPPLITPNTPIPPPPTTSSTSPPTAPSTSPPTAPSTPPPTGPSTPPPTGPSTPPPVQAPAEIIVDDLDNGFNRGGPVQYWHEANIGYNDHVYYTDNTTNLSYNTGIWKPQLLSGGNYSIYVYVPSSYSSTTNAIYAIYHNSFTDVRIMNQGYFANEWVLLGTYSFTGDGSEYVKLQDLTGEASLSRYVGFDAVKWVKQ